MLAAHTRFPFVWALAIPLAVPLAAGAEPPTPAASAPEPATARSATELDRQPTAAVETPAASAPDPSATLNEGALRNLRALYAGTWPKDVSLETSFSVSLDEPTAVVARLKDLNEEVAGLEQQRIALEARLATLDQDLPLPAVPALATPEAPPLPAGLQPADLAEPQGKRPRGRRLTATQREALAAYKATLAERLAAIAAHAQEVAAVQALRAERKTALAADLANVVVRVELASLRRGYLEAWIVLAADMSTPARTVLNAFAQPRVALRAEAALFTQTTEAAERLSKRLNQLQDSAAAGSLLGFRPQQEAIVQELLTLRQAFAERSDKARQRGSELTALADELEAEGKRLRQSLLRSAVEPGGQATRDELFLHYLRELRGLRRTIARAPVTDPNARVAALTGQLDAVAADPATVASVAEAEGVVAKGGAAAEEMQRVNDVGLASARQWRLAFVREAVTLFESTADKQVRTGAYGISTEMLQDLQADLEQVSAALLTWFAERRAAAVTLTARGDGAVPWQQLLHLALALAAVVVWLFGRRRTPTLVSWLVRRVSRLRWAHGRVGVVVRWSGLAHALAPTLVGGACAYLAFWLLGFDLPEVQLIEIVYRWLWLYLLGKQALLGLTHRLSPGRPAVIDASHEVVAKLTLTYRRAGLVLALGALTSELGLEFLGSGLLQSLVRWAVWLWSGGWAIWAATYWRTSLAGAWRRAAAAESRERQVASWMEGKRAGALLAPAALGRLFGGVIWRNLGHVLSQQGIAAYLKARALRRLSSKEARAGTSTDRDELPERYVREFPLYPVLGEEDLVVLPRTEAYRELDEQLERWRQKRTDSSVVVLGEKGIGKTTLLDMFSRRCGELTVHKVTLVNRVISGEAVAHELSRELGMGSIDDVDALATRLREGPEQVVLIDDAHNTFMRVIDGYGGFDALVRLANATSEKVFWVLVFNSFAWDFLNASRGRVHYFRRLFQVPRWTVPELQDLIGRRNERAGFQIVFDEQLLDDERVEGAAFRLIEGADGYFRLLWEASNGNARLATHLWLQSLTAQGNDTVHVGLFRQPRAEALTNAGDDVLFSLAAICQHENLTEDELQRVLNVGPGFAHFAMRYLIEYGFVEAKECSRERMTLSPRHYLQVVRALRAKHLLYVED